MGTCPLLDEQTSSLQSRIEQKPFSSRRISRRPNVRWNFATKYGSPSALSIFESKQPKPRKRASVDTRRADCGLVCSSPFDSFFPCWCPYMDMPSPHTTGSKRDVHVILGDSLTPCPASLASPLVAHSRRELQSWTNQMKNQDHPSPHFNDGKMACFAFSEDQ